MNESPVLLHLWSVHPEQEATLVQQLTDMLGHASAQPGFVSARILASADRTSVAALVEMRSVDDRQRLEQLPEVHDTLYNVQGAYNVAIRLYHQVAACDAASPASSRAERTE